METPQLLYEFDKLDSKPDNFMFLLADEPAEEESQLPYSSETASLDFNSLLNSSQFMTPGGDDVFDLLGSKAVESDLEELSLASESCLPTVDSYMSLSSTASEPNQPTTSDSTNWNCLSIKSEPLDSPGSSSCSYTPAASPLTDPVPSPLTDEHNYTGTPVVTQHLLAKLQSTSVSSGRSSYSKGGKKKPIDKNSEDYRSRRERNNIAVRKSRLKAKQRCVETEHRVRILNEQKEALERKVESLTRELNVMRQLLANVATSSLDARLLKRLGIK